MPLKVLSLDEAFGNRKADVAKWPADKESQDKRLAPLARPTFSAPFKIRRDELIFTVGSCFARNVEAQLSISGFDYAAKNFDLKIEESDFRGMDVSGVLNKYVVHSILNDLRWALDPSQPFTDDNYVELRGGKWWDPHLNNTILPAARERVLHRRDRVSHYFKTAAQAGVFIITLGLVEAWYDTKTGLYANGTPPATIRQTEPDRFEFHILEYQQILDALDEIHALLAKFGRPDFKILITVSPVTLGVTFGGEDILVANSYSKSVQRAAVAAFVSKYENVVYFPSYESVTLSDRRRAWEPDQRHASDEIVRYNVLTMMDAYMERDPNRVHELADGKSDSERVAVALGLMYEAEEADQEGFGDRAATLYADAAKLAPGEGLILMNYARFLLKRNDPEQAVEMAKASVEVGSGRYGGFGLLATAYRVAGKPEEALQAIDGALALFPGKIGNIHAKALICVALGRREEALGLYETIITRQAALSDLKSRDEFIKRYLSTAEPGVDDERTSGFLAAIEAQQAADKLELVR